MHRLVEVADLPHLVSYPGIFDALLEGRELRDREVVLLEAFEDRFSGQHSRFDRQMDSLQAHGIQEAAGISDQKPAFEEGFGHRKPSAFRNGLGAVGDYLRTFEPARDLRMKLESLELGVRIILRMPCIESHHKSQRQDLVGASVSKAAPERLGVQREAHRMDN